MKLLCLFLPLLFPAISEAQISFGPSRTISDFIANPTDTIAADMDGDGDLDVISQEGNEPRVIWWENDGSGKFGNRREWVKDDLFTHVISLADYNGDGRPDVWLKKQTSFSMVPPHLSTYQYWIAVTAADGTIGPPVDVAAFTYSGGSDSSSRVADMNSDGKPDLLMSDGIWLQSSDGSFKAPPPSTFRPEQEYLQLEPDANESNRVVIDDFDGDGDMDLVFPVQSQDFSGVRISFNLGNGELGPPVAAGFLPTTEEVSLLVNIPPAAGETSARLLAFTRRRDSQNPAVPQLWAATFSPLGEFSVITREALAVSGLARDWSVHSVVWDEEKDRAILIYNNSTSLEVTNLHVEATVTAFEIPTTDSGFAKTPLFDLEGSIAEASLADLDGDGKKDLLLPFSTIYTTGPFAGQLVWQKAIDDGSFQTNSRAITQPALSGEILFSGDFDGDGDDDILTTGGYRVGTLAPSFVQRHEVILWKNDGGGAAFERKMISGKNDSIDVIAVEDRDGDGDQDLLVQTFNVLFEIPVLGRKSGYFGDYQIVWLMQQPDGSFSRDIRFSNQSFGLIEGAKLLDWNGDSGSTDLRDVVGTLIDPFENNNAAGYFRATSAGFKPFWPISGYIQFFYGWWADLDRDGDTDFYWMLDDYFPSTFGFWFQNNLGAAAAAELLPRAIWPLEADVDGDGFEDFGDETGFLLSRPGMTFEPMSVPTEGWTGLVDLDTDGDLDALVAEPTLNIQGYSTLKWAENNGTGFQPAQSIAPAILADRRKPAMADLDGDGIRDLIVHSSEGNPRLEWFRITKKAEPADFTAWMAGQGATGNRAGPLSDMDGDGAANWEEFVFGSDPAVSDPDHEGRPHLERQPSGLVYTFQRRSGLTANPWVEMSTDLEHWAEPEFNVPPPVPTVVGYEKMRYGSDRGDRMFFRTVIPSP